ncbi:MAG: CbiX/SirB N-terminal domain-containing protein [Armatimonas sp.]
MNGLLILVHGSPTPGANDAMFAVVDELRERAAYDAVAVGFMECNEPSIPEAIDTLAAQGATEIVAVPYFLHTGTHVCEDLPAALEEASARYPQIHFRLGDYLGLSPVLTTILEERALS